MEINKILSNAGLKCTGQRIKVMEILTAADLPMSAENIHALTDGMSLSTVYRIAEKLCEKGILSKNTIRDSDKFYYELIGGAHRHYAICLSCGQMRRVNVCPVAAPDIDGFTVTGHKLEIYGYCAECERQKQTAKKRVL